MSNRLQVLLEAKEYSSFRKIAESFGLSLGEWVRQSLRKSAQECSAHDPDKKLKAVRKAVTYAYPSGDIDTMLKEIEQGYLS